RQPREPLGSSLDGERGPTRPDGPTCCGDVSHEARSFSRRGRDRVAMGFGFEVAKAVQQIAGFALSGAFGGSVVGNRWRAFAMASGQDIAVAATEAFSGGFVQTATGLVGGVVNFQQQ